MPHQRQPTGDCHMLLPIKVLLRIGPLQPLAFLAPMQGAAASNVAVRLLIRPDNDPGVTGTENVLPR